jgi:hypothetical protein
MQNKKRYATNTSGHAGVSWHKAQSKWQARIGDGGRRKSLGYFTDEQQAAQAYRAAKAAIHQFSPEPR